MTGIVTLYQLIPVIGPTEIDDADLVARPRLAEIGAAIAHHFDEPFEHVTVLYEGERRDMFVGETSSINGRHIRNIRATAIYRANALAQNPGMDPESLPAISGPAVLFINRRIWF